MKPITTPTTAKADPKPFKNLIELAALVAVLKSFPTSLTAASPSATPAAPFKNASAFYKALYWS